MNPSPRDYLLPWQTRWIEDKSRFKIALQSRQTGKSHGAAFDAVEDCLTRRTKWVCLSRGERQSLEWMQKAQLISEAWDVAISGYTEDRESPEALMKSAEIAWPNRSRLIAIPANPATARGYDANLVLDEFAFHEDPDAIWRAIYPSITNPLREKFRLQVLSTPNGMGNKFADLWHKDNGWSKHKLTIHDAVAQGFDVDIEQIRAGLDDPEGWAQEYECAFIDASSVLLPYDLIAHCESDTAFRECDAGFWETRGNPVYLGIDFARKRDLTVCWALEQVGDVLVTREVLELRGMDTPTQTEILGPRIRRAQRVSLDYTGPGVGFGDYLAAEHGTYDPDGHKFGRVELVTFTNPSKVDMFSKLRMAFEALKLRIPIARDVREDLHSIQRVSLAGGGVTYRAPHTPDGHADRCTALALAIRAAATGAAGAITDPNLIRFGTNRLNVASVSPRRWSTLKPV